MRLQAFDPVGQGLVGLPLELVGVRITAGGNRVGQQECVGPELLALVLLQVLGAETGPVQTCLGVTALESGERGALAEVRRGVLDPGTQRLERSQLARDSEAGRSCERLIQLVLDSAATVQELRELVEVIRVGVSHAHAFFP